MHRRPPDAWDDFMKGTTSAPSPGSGPGRTPGGPLPAFDYQPLGRVIFEAGAIARLGEAVRWVGGTRVLLVTDPGLEHAGHPQRAEQAMLAAGLTVFTFDGVVENPTEREVTAGVAFAQKHDIDCIVAVGGGSSRDWGKGHRLS